MLHSSFTREQPNDTLAALRMAPMDPFAILAAKIAANFCFLLVAEALLLPIFAALYNLSILPVLGRISLVLVLGTLALATVGTVFSAIASQARMRKCCYRCCCSLLAPALIASTEATVGLSTIPHLSVTWTVMLAAFDVIF